MLLLRGISDLPSNPTEVLAVSTPAWQPGATRDPEPTISSDIPQFPFKTDTSQCVLPAASSLGTVVSPRFNGGRLPSSPNSAIGTSSTHAYTHIHTHAGNLLGGKALCFSCTPIFRLAYCLVLIFARSSISSLGAHIGQVPTDGGACSVHCALKRETTANSNIRQLDNSKSGCVNCASHLASLQPYEGGTKPKRSVLTFRLHRKRMYNLQSVKAVTVNVAK